MAEKVKDLAEIVGSENVLTDGIVLEEYSKDMSFVPRIRPKCLVKLENSDRVKSLVDWANKTSTPLVPVSSGGPHFRGDTVPSAGGAVIADLSGMKGITRVDRRNRVAMVEPGVTFTEMIPALEEKGLRLNMPLLPRSTKSVIGSMLEREPVIMPLHHWDAMDPLTCIEVIFGNGDSFRTGSAAGPGTLEEQWKAGQAQVNPMGPGQTDLVRVVQGSQGTIGIVNWATVKCEAIPSIQSPFLARGDRIEKLIDFIYRLIWLKLVDECLLINNTTMAAILSQDAKEYAVVRDTLPRWIFFFCLSGYEYFPEERVVWQEESMMEAAKQYGVKPEKSISSVTAQSILKILSKPSDDPYWKLRYKGACAEIPFLTTLDKVPGFINVMYDTAGQCDYPSSDIGVYIQPMVQGSSCHCEFNLIYDQTNSKEAAKIRKLYEQAGEALMNAGAFFSRPYGAIVDMAYRKDGETTAALKKTKMIFDPNSIMNPGKLCF